MRTLSQARAMLIEELQARGVTDIDARLATVEAVLCEDFETVMLYAWDGTAWIGKYFELPARVDSINSLEIEHAVRSARTAIKPIHLN